MLQTLFHIPLISLQVAFYLLLAGLGMAAVRNYIQTRKFADELWSWLGILLVGGGIVFFVAPNVAEEQGLPIRGYGLFLLLGILAAFCLLHWQAKKKGMTSDHVVSLCLWAVFCGIFGARLFYFIEYREEMTVLNLDGSINLVSTLFSFLNIAAGGLVVFGSIIGGTLGSLIFLCRNKLPIFSTLDMMAPAVMIGIAFGRIGCLMNGCCFGGVCDAHHGIVFPEHSPAHQHQIIHGETFYDGLKFKAVDDDGEAKTAISEVQPGSAAEKAGLKPDMIVKSISGMINGSPHTWNVTSPQNVPSTLAQFRENTPNDNLRLDLDIASEDALTKQKPFFLGPTPSPVMPVYPTQIYSSIAAALLCLTLLGLGRLQFFRRRDSLVFAAFLLLYPIIRFQLEIFRNDEPPVFGTGMTISQVVSLGVFVLGIGLTAWILCRRTR